MNELIKIEINENGEQLVSARKLHKFLEVKARFNDWFPRMCEYGFIENKDYIAITQKRVTAQGNETTYMNYLMKISMAKELSMIQRNAKGKEAREYFIKCEEAWNSDEIIMARAIKIQNRKIIEYRKQIEDLEYSNQIKDQQIAEFKPIKDYVDTILSSPNALAISQIAADYGMTGAELNKTLHEKGVIKKIGGQWLLCKKYLGKGYTQSKTYSYKTVLGFDRTVIATYWTQKGRLKIHEILTSLGIQANQDKENEINS